MVVLATDAATSNGWGATLRNGASVHKAKGLWALHERHQPIHILEMRGILMGIRSFPDKLRGRNVQIVTDNMICKHTLPVGSRLEDLGCWIKAISDELCALDASLVDVAWIPSEANVIPDFLSRHVDVNDWTLTREAWQAVQAWWPQLAVDRFASPENAKLLRFNTRWAHPESESYNAMAQDWSREFSYACPPLAMVGPVLQLVQEQGARAVVVVPEWIAQPWWPLLQRLAKKRLRLGPGAQVFQAGMSGQCAPHKNSAWTFWAVEVDGRGPRN